MNMHSVYAIPGLVAAGIIGSAHAWAASFDPTQIVAVPPPPLASATVSRDGCNQMNPCAVVVPVRGKSQQKLPAAIEARMNAPDSRANS